jgi:hypothetical protein
MAAPTNALTTAVAIGNREDLSDMIYRIDPTDTPCMSSFERETATAITHEWQTQALAAASTTNFQLEGDAVTADSATVTVRLTNLCQIARKAAGVSGTQLAVRHAGRENELDYQMTLKGMELKRDMETTLVGTNVAKSSTDPRKLASILSWIKSNTDKSAAGGATDPTAADGTSQRTDGTQRAFEERFLKNVLSAAWTAGGKPDCVYVGAFNKQQFSTFVGRATPTEDTRAKKITASVNYYDSDFGLLDVVASRFSRTRDALVLQTDMWAVAYMSGRRFVSFPLAKSSDSDQRAIISEYTLVSRNEKSSGGVFDLTTS